MHTKVITMQPVAVSTSPSVPSSRRSRSTPYRRSTRSSKYRTAAFFIANGRKAFDRFFVARMNVAIAQGSAMDAAAARVQLPMKRPRIGSIAPSAPPRKKARISSIKDSSLTAERSESPVSVSVSVSVSLSVSLSVSVSLGSFWTTVPNRRGDMVLVRRSHRLTRIWAEQSSPSVMILTCLKRTTPI